MECHPLETLNTRPSGRLIIDRRCFPRIFLLENWLSTFFKGTVMQIKKALINDHLCVSKVSWKFRIPTIYNFGVIYPWSLLFSWKVVFFLTVSIVFLFISKTLRVNNLKTRTAMNAQNSVFVICVEAIICLLLYNLHNCTFKNNIYSGKNSTNKYMLKVSKRHTRARSNYFQS